MHAPPRGALPCPPAAGPHTSPARAPKICDVTLPSCLPAALDRALKFYKEQPEEWVALRGRIMSDAMRFSWDFTAGSYVNLYGQVVSM